MGGAHLGAGGPEVDALRKAMASQDYESYGLGLASHDATLGVMHPWAQQQLTAANWAEASPDACWGQQLGQDGLAARGTWGLGAGSEFCGAMPWAQAAAAAGLADAAAAQGFLGNEGGVMGAAWAMGARGVHGAYGSFGQVPLGHQPPLGALTSQLPVHAGAGAEEEAHQMKVAMLQQVRAMIHSMCEQPLDLAFARPAMVPEQSQPAFAKRRDLQGVEVLAGLGDSALAGMDRVAAAAAQAAACAAASSGAVAAATSSANPGSVPGEAAIPTPAAAVAAGNDLRLAFQGCTPATGEERQLGQQIASAVADFLSGNVADEPASEDGSLEGVPGQGDGEFSVSEPEEEATGEPEQTTEPTWRVARGALEEGLERLHPCLQRGRDLSHSLAKLPLPQHVQEDRLPQLHRVITSCVSSLYNERRKPTLTAVQERLREQRIEEATVQLLLPICAREPTRYHIWLPSDGQVSLVLVGQPLEDAHLEEESAEVQYSPEFVEAFTEVANKKIAPALATSYMARMQSIGGLAAGAGMPAFVPCFAAATTASTGARGGLPSLLTGPAAAAASMLGPSPGHGPGPQAGVAAVGSCAAPAVTTIVPGLLPAGASAGPPAALRCAVGAPTAAALGATVPMANAPVTNPSSLITEAGAGGAEAVAAVGAAAGTATTVASSQPSAVANTGNLGSGVQEQPRPEVPAEPVEPGRRAGPPPSAAGGKRRGAARAEQNGGASSSAPALAASLQAQGVTTLMLRNLPHNVTQKRLVEELTNSGFAGLYDFCYMPSTFGTGVGKGYAFVNLTSPAALGTFVITWHGSRRFGITASEAALNVSAAALQGREQNAKKWDAPRMRRVRNPALRPLVIGQWDAEPEKPEAKPSSCGGVGRSTGTDQPQAQRPLSPPPGLSGGTAAEGTTA